MKHAHPTPSPTAAGELAKALIDHCDKLEVRVDAWDRKADDLMRKAAAALSGVAAQGDGEARVSEDAVRRACSAYDPIAFPHGQDCASFAGMRAALEAALGVADQEGKAA